VIFVLSSKGKHLLNFISENKETGSSTKADFMAQNFIILGIN